MNEINAYSAKVSTATHDLTRSWYRLAKRCDRARSELEAVIKEYETAKQALGDHLCPDKPPAQVGEKFNIWYGSGLLEIEFVTNSTGGRRYNISWRQEPGVKQLSDMA